jgi:UrcA family protein
MNRIVIIAAALLAAPIATSAFAETPAEHSRIVSYADLDLSRAGDVRKLDGRIGRAIAEVCGSASEADLEGRNEVRRCRAFVRESLSAGRNQALAAAREPAQVAIASR